MMNHKIKNDRGFVALISAVIIAVILLLIVTNLSFTGFYGRSDILDSELKERSSVLAEACVDSAILEIVNDPAYTGSETVTVSGGDTCTIEAIDPATNPIIINVRAVFRNATTKFTVKANQSDLSIVSWEEIP